MDARCPIRPATRADLARIARIEAASFADPWSVPAFAEHLGDVFLVAEDPTGLAGYVIGRAIADQGEILNLAVSPPARRTGLGRALLAAGVAELGRRGARELYLEVRASNAPALALYRGAGFREAGRRAQYYRRPVEDALILRLELVDA